MTKKEQKQVILDTIEDLVSNFTYYDRKGDEDLTIQGLINAVEKGIITVDEIVDTFAAHLHDYFEND